MVSRAERSALANWWWTIDRWILAAVADQRLAGGREGEGHKMLDDFGDAWFFDAIERSLHQIRRDIGQATDRA